MKTKETQTQNSCPCTADYCQCSVPRVQYVAAPPKKSSIAPRFVRFFQALLAAGALATAAIAYNIRWKKKHTAGIIAQIVCMSILFLLYLALMITNHQILLADTVVVMAAVITSSVMASYMKPCMSEKIKDQMKFYSSYIYGWSQEPRFNRFCKSGIASSVLGFSVALISILVIIWIAFKGSKSRQNS